MSENKTLQELSKPELIELIELYSKNWLALDGVWFQSVEAEYGMDAAMRHDCAAWRRYTVIEAKRIKQFLKLPEHPGLAGLKKALELRFYGNLNQHELILEEEKLVYRNIDCRVQTARKKKGMPYHPCKSVGEIEYAGFAAVIDPRISCRCISCFPDCTEAETGCAWLFELHEDAQNGAK